MTIYKYVSVVLFVCLLASGLYVWKLSRDHLERERQLNNTISKLEGVVKETETAWSKRGQELEDLKSKNKDLQKLIKSRDEEIVSLTNLVLHWKNKYFEIKDATGSVVGGDGTTVVVPPPECDSCLKDLRFRVDFDQTQDYLRVFGHTLTNPAAAFVNVEWTREIVMNMILTRDKHKHFRVYVDADTSDLVPSEIKLTVDPSIFERAWYEKVGFGLDMGAYMGSFTSGISAGFMFSDKFFAGPKVSVTLDGPAYGVQVMYFPWRDAQ